MFEGAHLSTSNLILAELVQWPNNLIKRSVKLQRRRNRECASQADIVIEAENIINIIHPLSGMKRVHLLKQLFTLSCPSIMHSHAH
jgi:hypothetical protein